MTENNWLEQYNAEKKDKSNYEQLPKLVILDGDQKQFRFADNGKEIKSSAYGDAILFTVVHEGEKKYFWVKKTRFSILEPIAKNMPVEGRECRITRIGKTKTDTRYSLVFFGSPGQTKVIGDSANEAMA